MVACPSCGEANPERARFCLNCGAALSTEGVTERARETRRRVTVLFSDVAGSTTIGERLDPEALREVMQRYFDAMRVAIERHEGTVEKFIGDAVMAVFGIPHLHEDDALRAVRAAFDMRAALETLNRDLAGRWGVQLSIRTGVNTGEVVAGDATTQQTLATGDVVNTAARLEQAAQQGEILIGAETHRLIRHAVRAEAVDPLTVKGKAEPVAAWHLESVDPLAPAQARRMDSPMVGRDRQLNLLTDAAARARDDRAPQLVTVLGLAGVGKSRLVHEFLGRVRADATVIRGRCLSYGDAITYWPLAEALRGAAEIDGGDPPEKALERLRALATGAGQAEVVAERVAAAIGLAPPNGLSSGGSLETFWAIRRLLEAMARRRPLVAVFDDVHWGTPTFLDLVEHITDWSRDAPMLLVAIARPELLETRPTWGGGKLNAATLLLEPLDEAAMNQILVNLTGAEVLPPELGRRIGEAAEGNPLFVEEFLSMLVEDGTLERQGDAYRATRVPTQIAVPPSIETLLAARLDQLHAEERAVLGRAAVVGKRFRASEVAQLSAEDERSGVPSRLMALVRKELLRLDEEAAPESDTADEELRFRFRHQLVRDAAYQSLPKQERARLHEAFASWMDATPAGTLPELHEVVGHHLEQAYSYRRALGADPASIQGLAERGADHLLTAAKRVRAIGDIPAVIRLVERAYALLPKENQDRIASLPMFAESLVELGRLEDAQGAVDEVLSSPEAPLAARAAALELAEFAFQQGRSAADVVPEVEEALRIRRELGEPGGIASALAAASQVAFYQGRLEAMAQLAEEGLPLARQAGATTVEARLRGSRSIARVFSSVGEARMEPALFEDLEFAREAGDIWLESGTLQALGTAAAMGGRMDEAFDLIARGLTLAMDVGLHLWGEQSPAAVQIDIWQGNLARAAERLRANLGYLTEIGERGVRSTMATQLATVLLDMEQTDEIDQLCTLAEETGAVDDPGTQVGLLAVRARLTARRGRSADAEEMARSAVAKADETEYHLLFVISRLALADVLRLAERPGEAADLVREVLAREEQRENRLYAPRLKEQITELTKSAAPTS